MAEHSKKELVIVSGLGRCGTSMVMQMLQRGGAPVVGEWPAFEPSEMNPFNLRREYLRTISGAAAKLIDPHHRQCQICIPHRVIWLDRRTQDQATSQLKFLNTLTGLLSVSRKNIRKMEKLLRRERKLALRSFHNAPILLLHFGEIIEAPGRAAEQIAAFVAPALSVEPRQDAMADAVIHRSPACAPDLSIEMKLIQQRLPGAMIAEALF